MGCALISTRTVCRVNCIVGYALRTNDVVYSIVCAVLIYKPSKLGRKYMFNDKE